MNEAKTRIDCIGNLRWKGISLKQTQDEVYSVTQRCHAQQNLTINQPGLSQSVVQQKVAGHEVTRNKGNGGSTTATRIRSSRDRKVRQQKESRATVETGVECSASPADKWDSKPHPGIRSERGPAQWGHRYRRKQYRHPTMNESRGSDAVHCG